MLAAFLILYNIGSVKVFFGVRNFCSNINIMYYYVLITKYRCRFIHKEIQLSAFTNTTEN